MNKIILEAQKITKQFPGVLALDNVNLRIVSGKVNALVGENGAGKSTLMNILSGVYTDYEGDILLNGKVQHFDGVVDAQRQGIAIIHQELCNVPNMNVAENMFLGREPLNRIRLVDYPRMHREARQHLSQLGLDIDTHTQMANLRVGQQQLVEIAKALMLNAKILIMDEPTSSLSEAETERLFGIIEDLKQKNVGIVYISHKMKEVWRLADFVTIMRDGKQVGEMQMSETSEDEIIALMARKEHKKESNPTVAKSAPKENTPLLMVKNLTLRHAQNSPCQNILQDISFCVAQGEVLGIYGLMGSGRTELLEALFGLHPNNVSASIFIDGKQTHISHPKEAVAHGMALCPEDRKNEGLVLDMSIEQNITLTALYKCLSKLGFINFRNEHSWAVQYCNTLSIKAAATTQKACQLSGGNQQKIVLAKWLLTQPRILMLDEPTRGIDINAKNEIYQLVRSFASKGMAVIVVSSELPEIMTMSDRILTLCQGRMGEIFHHTEFSEESILKASLPK